MSELTFTERLILAQQQIRVKRDATNPRFGSKYATLDAIIEAARPALAAQGLLLTQHVEDGSVTTRVSGSKSGDHLYSNVPICATLDDPQRYGAALTYARRYGIATLLCLATDDDDDGNSATPPPAQHKPTPAAAPAQGITAVIDQTRAAADQSETAATAQRLAQVEVHFGKRKGERLGDLTPRSLAWYATEWEPRFDERTGRVNADDEALKNAARLLHLYAANPAALADPYAAAEAARAATTAKAVTVDEADGIPF